MRPTLLLPLTVFLLISFGCKNPNQDLADRSIELLEGGLVVLETHQQNLGQAPLALQEYVERNQAEIEDLEHLAQELIGEGGKENTTAIKRRFLDKIKRLNPRLRAMAAIYGSNAEVMAALEKIQPRATR